MSVAVRFLRLMVTVPGTVSQLILGAAVLLIASVLASKASRVGIPALLLFLATGMLAGSEGPGGLAFDNPAAAQALGVLALALILFAGGLDTQWLDVRPIVGAGIALATLGVLLTAGLVALFVHAVLGFPWLDSALLGAIVSSTDAAAVFGVLRSRNVALPTRLRSLLELESGSNDPMAVFLTIGLITVMQEPDRSAGWLLVMFVTQMSLGAVLGYVCGLVMRRVVNAAHLDYEGLYPALTLGGVLLTYAATDYVGGNGFLAVYLAGLVMRAGDFIHKRSLVRFHDGLAWLMQIAMFLTLGLQVFPSRVASIAGVGLAIACFLMFIARPLAVFLILTPSAMSLRERALVGWVGLRGAAPIVLATFPLVAGVPTGSRIFDVVFFIVVTSALVQGTTVSWVARALHLSMPTRVGGVPLDPLEIIATGTRELVDVRVPRNSLRIGERLLDLRLPRGALVVLIERNGRAFVPHGGAALEPDDRLLVLVEREFAAAVQERFAEQPQIRSGTSH